MMINITINGNSYNLVKNKSLKIEDFDTEMYIFNPNTDNIMVLNTTSRFIFLLFYNEEKNMHLTINELLSKIKKEYTMTDNEEKAFEKDLQLLLETMINEGVLCVQ